MAKKHYDFAILGDTQAEGLLFAAALARKSYSVCLIPSEALGEWPSQNPWPLRFPERSGKHRLDDFLFRAGFFRLEDSGLEQGPYRNQFILPRHRVSLDGSQSTWIREVLREFPQISDSLLKLRSIAKKPENAQVSNFQFQSLLRKNEDFEKLAQLDCFEGRPFDSSKSESSRRLSKAFLSRLDREEAKVFRVKSDLQQPYNRFLLEHAKKWGVQVLSESSELKAQWGKFEIMPQVKAKYLVANTLAGAKMIHQLKSRWLPHKISHWLYFDRLDCVFDEIPEPLDEFSYLQFPQTEASQTVSLLYVQRDRLRDKARLTLGTWLPFDESRHWESEITASRARLSKVLPFLPAERFPSMPSTLELSEMKGECVRRAELDRLSFVRQPKSTASKAWHRFRSLFSKKAQIFADAPRLISCLPYLGRKSGRHESLAECLRALDYFEKKKPPASASPQKAA